MLKSYLNIRDDNMSFFPIMAASIANMAEIEARAVELNNIGVDMANEGNFEEALEFFSQAHSLVPEDPSIAENIRICLDAIDSE